MVASFLILSLSLSILINTFFIFQGIIYSLQQTDVEKDIIACSGYLKKVPGDQSCTKYYSCTRTNGTTIIEQFTCPHDQFFNADLQSCVQELPTGCSDPPVLHSESNSSSHLRKPRSLSLSDLSNSISVSSDNAYSSNNDAKNISVTSNGLSK